MSANKIAQRYAKAVLDLAIENKELETVYKDINAFDKALGSNRDLKLLLKSPIVNTDKKQTILQRIFGDGFHKITNSFLDIIVRKRREFYLPEIFDAFIAQYRNHKGMVTAELVSAVAVDDALVEKVKAIVRKHTGKSQVILSTSVDASIVGGFILKFEDELFDSSIAHKLESLKKGFEKNKYVREF